MSGINIGRGTSMAMQTALPIIARAVSLRRLTGHLNVFRSLLLLLALLFGSVSALAQFQSAFVFAADPANPKSVAVYTRNDVTGVLAPVPGSPFPSKEPVNAMTLDFKGRYLFTASYSPSKISMFTVDPDTGAVHEVPNSPFASLHTNTPVFLSAETSGQFLYVIDFYGSNGNVSALESFQIDPVNLDLVPSSSGATDLPGLLQPCGAGTHPSGKTFYAYVNDISPSNPNAPFFLVFDGSTGAFTVVNRYTGTLARCLAVDPLGQRVAVGSGSELDTFDLNPDGTLTPYGATNPTAAGTGTLTFDTFGRFIYANIFDGQTNGYRVHIFSATSLSLQELQNSPLPSSFPLTDSWTVDPTAPLIFADQVYQVDPLTGVPSPILSASPITPPVVFSRPPGSQPILGPIAQLSANSLSFGSLSVGQSSTAQTLTITSDGGQALSLNTLTITGANSGDFSETDTCHVPTVLQPGNSCSVLVSFAPSAVGNRSAALTITDNASPTTESVQLTGTGLTPAPAVTLVPGTLDFGTVTQGTSTPASISVQNSGTAALHIASVVLGGANSSDFSVSAPTCSAAISTNSNCTATVTFTPLAPGVRSASITLTDDAPDSPQVINVSGNANPAFDVAPAAGSSSTASVTAGQTAQYQMQLVPGAGYSGTISLSCSGAPLGAACQVPASVSLSNGAAAQFSVTVTTSGAAMMPPSAPMRFTPIPGLRLLPLLAYVLVLLMAYKNLRILEHAAARGRLTMYGALGAIVFCAFLSITGCGGGSAAVAPPPLITPSGTSTITVTPSAMSSSGKPLQLQPIQLTLTVK